MSTRYDAIIIGSGIAGYAAALHLKNQGKKVAVLSKATGATSVSSGAWDFGTMHRKTPFSFDEYLKTGLCNTSYSGLFLPSTEPISGKKAKAMAAEISLALGEFLELKFSFDKNFILPTSRGNWKATFGAQKIQSYADLDNIKDLKIGLVGSPKWRFPFDAITAKLKESASRIGHTLNLKPVSLDFEDVLGDCPLPHFATRLNADEGTRSLLLEKIKNALKDEPVEFLLFPPLFLDSKLAENLSTELNIGTAECLSSSEPIAGYRLHSAIMKSLSKEQIPFISISQLEHKSSENKIQSLSVLTQEGWKTLEASFYILASGKLFGGGIELGYFKVRETVFDLPVFGNSTKNQVKNRAELDWQYNSFFEAQPWASLGLKLDKNWSPVDEADCAVYENLRACGSIIGGMDLSHSQLGLGFSAVTGIECTNGI